MQDSIFNGKFLLWSKLEQALSHTAADDWGISAKCGYGLWSYLGGEDWVYVSSGVSLS